MAALLVIAHPDDECMFFTPTLRRLMSEMVVGVYVLCLSTGDYDSKGSIRTAEVKKSCTTLGIPDENVTVLDHPRLRDGPDEVWDRLLISDIVAQHVARLGIGKVRAS